MMLLIGLAVLSQAQPASAPLVQRVWKAGQKDKYRVEMVIKDAGGDMHSDFTMQLLAPKTASTDTWTDVTATFFDQTITFWKVKKQPKGVVGTSVVRFNPTGVPLNLYAKTQAAALMLPLFAWTPPETPDANGKFTITGYVTDDGIKAGGTGKLTIDKEAKVAIDWNLTTDRDQPFASLTTTGYFEPKTGRMIRSEGMLKTKEGSAEFKVK